jgi:hypothetical protein
VIQSDISPPIFDAYYNADADALYGHCVYLALDGHEVRITEVVRAGRSPLDKDAVFVGRVFQIIRSEMRFAASLEAIRKDPVLFSLVKLEEMRASKVRHLSN